MKPSLWRTKKALCWKTLGMLDRGCASALAGKGADAVHKITSGLSRIPVKGSSKFCAVYLSYLVRTYAKLGHVDDARRCIAEAMTAVEATEERCWEAEVHRMAGKLRSSRRSRTWRKRSVFRACARRRPPTTSKILGTPRRNEPRQALA